MKNPSRFLAAIALLLLAANSFAQSSDSDEQDSLKMAALEALITAPPERALPIVDKVLAGNNSVELKERALFILSQMDTAEAQTRMLAYARDSEGELQSEAIRMIGGDHPRDEPISQMVVVGRKGARPGQALLHKHHKWAFVDIEVPAPSVELIGIGLY